jgi:AraC-like DNA-binding protein
VAAFIKEAGVAEKVNRQYSDMVTKLFVILPGMKISVSVQEIAKMMSASESTLAKHFKKETGMSIGRYRERLIMDRARQLLAMGKLSLGEIAEELGFCDQFYFCKYFKHRQGMTPSAYRVYYRK